MPTEFQETQTLVADRGQPFTDANWSVWPNVSHSTSLILPFVSWKIKSGAPVKFLWGLGKCPAAVATAKSRLEKSGVKFVLGASCLWKIQISMTNMEIGEKSSFFIVCWDLAGVYFVVSVEKAGWILNPFWMWCDRLDIRDERKKGILDNLCKCLTHRKDLIIFGYWCYY